MVEQRDDGVYVHLLLDGRVESDKYSDCNMVANLSAPGTCVAGILPYMGPCPRPRPTPRPAPHVA